MSKSCNVAFLREQMQMSLWSEEEGQCVKARGAIGNYGALNVQYFSLPSMIQCVKRSILITAISQILRTKHHRLTTCLPLLFCCCHDASGLCVSPPEFQIELRALPASAKGNIR